MFAPNWGSRLVQNWVHDWVSVRQLPQSNRGRHSKINSVLSDPTAREAIQTYLRSHKWAINPPKLEKLMKGEMLPVEAAEYCREIEHDEMPRGLKSFIEEKLLPRLHIPPETLLHGSKLVLVAHDEMVAQAHDGLRYTWVLNGEQPLRKKGVGRGLHQSDFICSTVGWLEEASGMWNGELFAKQLEEKFFPAFAAAHGPGHTAVILVDNSQGHASYASDALRASAMNLKPGGKQPRMHPGWYIRDGIKVVQSMVFPLDHHTHPNQPKGMKAILQERENMPKALRSVPVDLIRKWEHRSWRFIDAYSENLDATDALYKVKAFSSRKYKSHRRNPEQLAQAMDEI
ncbi:hypothetical protein F5878DRAFT_654823 [Lentinula raphanica]|uniref:Uncharacterized protein n=1 Tax=Lentinula raphanica TaxID=153919 RepID=A0AA38NVN8_9AGAR|nr:hypothetical protein F5878DRAFT_654823 [Lentinula raphanica]